MASRETQRKIIDCAIALFNAEGTGKVSTIRISEAAGISKGNLHYHYKSKQEIILAIWGRIAEEMQDWGNDAATPTLEHMAELTQRQFRLIWRYRFFYRELTTLLQQDEELKYRFVQLRETRMERIKAFFLALIDAGVVTPPDNPGNLDDLIKIAWLITDYWISFIGVDDRDIDMQSMQDGYQLMVQLFRPILSDKALKVLPDTFKVFDTDSLGAG
jgi:AcrR family transcriptional regulator